MFRKFTKFLTIAAVFLLAACSDVPVGHVGIKVFKFGGDKGVDHEVLPVGRYWIGVNEALYTFPTYTQTDTWRRGSQKDESITFQTKEGLSVNGDFGIQFSVDPKKVPVLFQKYRRGIDEISDLFLRNEVRDAAVNLASSQSVEYIYGEGKAKFVDEIEEAVRKRIGDQGINIEKVYVIDNFRLPPQVTEAINAKIQATQIAIQRQNEIVTARAEADKKIEAARGEAESIKTVAKGQAEANELVSKSLTPELLENKRLEKWDGKNPTHVLGNASVPLVTTYGINK